MLFHSPAFVFGFLPICLTGFTLIHRRWGWQPALLWLAAASIVFYGQWSLSLVALLVGSVLANYAVARALIAQLDHRSRATALLIGAVATNLCLLGYFKYSNFFLDNVGFLVGTTFSHLDIILPVGISFYTFIQIGFLVEVYNRQVNDLRFAHYFLFGTFFPCVTAGPIILQKDMMPQFQGNGQIGELGTRISIGMTVFAIGLVKKLVLADNIAPFADAVFDGVAAGALVEAPVAWIGALSYTLQLYFDFSGYSDMALGSAMLFGLRLPLNFNSPLKACSITDFWRRWHMTITRFFTNYLYSPIAMIMMRRSMLRAHGRWQRYVSVIAMPVTLTMALAGLWHGSGWTFVVFGVLHGVALAVNHGWREAGLPALPRLGGWLCTMAVVVTGMVIFRADDVPTAIALLTSMIGIGGGLTEAGAGAVPITIDTGFALIWIVILGGIALACPNSQEILHDHWYSSDPQPEVAPSWPSWLTWRPTLAWGAIGAILLAAALGSMTGDTAFLYYKF